jgi:hypothetical protein
MNRSQSLSYSMNIARKKSHPSRDECAALSREDNFG